jgi:hypothetical protein
MFSEKRTLQTAVFQTVYTINASSAIQVAMIEREIRAS